jgi:hypothetical protein
MPANDLHGKISSTVIHRINFPRHLGSGGKVGSNGVTYAISRKASLNAKSRPMLSEEEEIDVAQTVGFVLIATGAMERESLTLSDWKEVFRAVRGADCLRIDRKSKNQSEIISVDTMTEEALAVISARLNIRDNGLDKVKRRIQARKIRYERACIMAKFQADTSRKRKAGYRGACGFLRWISTYYTSGKGKSLSDIITAFSATDRQSKSLWDAAERYRDYIETGEAILTGEAMADIAPRTYKSFEDLTWGAGLHAS